VLFILLYPLTEEKLETIEHELANQRNSTN
jgi:hypothetical protein